MDDAGTFQYLDTKFDALATSGTLDLSEENTPYIDIASEGEWHIDANAEPTSIKYNLKFYTTNFSGLEDNKFSIVKRPTCSSDATDWACASCGLSADAADGINANDGSGFFRQSNYD